MNTFSKLPAIEKSTYFKVAASQAGLGPQIVEKDFWVCWTLEHLFALDETQNEILFKGGTSLSKVYNLIERFSEDIDISIGKTIVGISENDIPENKSGSNERARSLKVLAEKTKTFVQTTLINALESRIKPLLPTDEQWSLVIDNEDPDGQTILFNYPTAVEVSNEYIPTRVKIEIGTRSDQWPTQQFEIKSIVAEQLPDQFLKTTSLIRTMEVTRTFWEKATILHYYAHLPEGKKINARQSRHYYDFYKLLKSPYKDKATNDLGLLERVAKHKQIYFKAGHAKYELAKKGTLKLIPDEQVTLSMKNDYSLMTPMIIGTPPEWEEILKVISEFEKEFNQNSAINTHSPT